MVELLLLSQKKTRPIFDGLLLFNFETANDRLRSATINEINVERSDLIHTT